jgi:transformation/transcription domain-associated protein
MHCIEHHKDPQRPVFAFNDDVRRSLADEKVSTLEGEEGRAAVMAKRLEIYTKICESERANQALLSRRLQSRLDGAEGFFYFRRVFAQQWAVDCLLQHVFAIADRTPGRVVVVTNSGRVLSPDARVSYNNQGFVERRTVPFRLSPNIASLIGFPLLSGHFVPSMSRVALAVHENQHVMDPILKVLLRDDLTSFYTKSIAKPDNKTQEMERQLMDRIVKNTATVKTRFAECSPTVKDLDKAKSRPVDYKVRELVAAAQDPSKLCMMQGSYQGWL